jgi:basic amino acid/polyamine antiporter, APA family
MPSGNSARLKKELGPGEFFTLSFGSIVGVGWLVLLGDWLRQGGPGGAILAFLAGGLVTLLVGFCYAEMAALFPVSGGEVAYTYEVFGLRTSYATGWFLILNYIAASIFQGVSVGLIADTLLPGIGGPLLYTSRGSPVYLGSLILGLGGMLVITGLNYLGVKPVAIMQNVLTYGKIALFVVVVGVGVTWGKFANLNPILRPGTPAEVWAGVFRVFLTTPFWLAGFNSVVQVVEEKTSRTSIKLVGWMILLSILSATVFYCLVVLACSMTMPWPNLIALEMPAATAFEAAFHATWMTRAVLLVALLGNFTVWNSVFLSATRILFALGRARIISAQFSEVHPQRGVPEKSVFFVGVLGCIGVFLGRGAILPMVHLSSSCFAISYILVCLCVLRIRIEQPFRIAPYRTPGGKVTATAGVAASIVILYLSLHQPYVDAGRKFPIEWLMFFGWSTLGALFWVTAHKIRKGLSEVQRRSTILNNTDMSVE